MMALNSNRIHTPWAIAWHLYPVNPKSLKCKFWAPGGLPEAFNKASQIHLVGLRKPPLKFEVHRSPPQIKVEGVLKSKFKVAFVMFEEMNQPTANKCDLEPTL